MPDRNVGERDALVRQVVAGAGFLFAATNVREHPILALAATVLAVDLAVTAAARWCWANELLGLDTRALDGGPTRALPPPHRWAPPLVA